METAEKLFQLATIDEDSAAQSNKDQALLDAADDYQLGLACASLPILPLRPEFALRKFLSVLTRQTGQNPDSESKENAGNTFVVGYQLHLFRNIGEYT
ncbi:MAG: hypothetical protein ACYTG0_02380 [Planctomycetota bacterium]